ncbi:MAG: PilZ domain-containing protein [Emcibacter sp.]|nr:PilZ domain-containing protein [Emcibacter sp.]
MSNVDQEVDEENRRRYGRQHVLLKARLDTGEYEFECVAYDLSLSGARIKLNLPLQTQCEVWLIVKDSPHIPAKVIRVNEGFIGLEFSLPPEQISKMLGNIGSQLPKA